MGDKEKAAESAGGGVVGSERRPQGTIRNISDNMPFYNQYSYIDFT